MARYRITLERPSRAREAAVEYKPSVSQPLQAPGVYHVTVADRGRLVLPAEVREKLKIRDGDRVAVTLEQDGSISITTRQVALDHLQGMFKHLNRPGRFRCLNIPRKWLIATSRVVIEMLPSSSIATATRSPSRILSFSRISAGSTSRPRSVTVTWYTPEARGGWLSADVGYSTAASLARLGRSRLISYRAMLEIYHRRACVGKRVEIPT